MGVGIDVPRHRQTRRRKRRAHSPRAAERLGGQSACRAGAACCRRSRRSARTSTRRSRAARRSRWPTSSCSAAARPSRRPRRTRGTTLRCSFTPGRTDATQEQTDVALVRRLRTEGRRFPQLSRQRRRPFARGAARRSCATPHAERSRDDGAGRRPARSRRERRMVPSTASSRNVRARSRTISS